MAQVMMGNYRGANGQFIVNNLATAFTMLKNNKTNENALVVFADFVKKYPTLSNIANKTSLAIIRNLYTQGARSEGYNGYKLREMGGPIPYGDGGATTGPVQQGIPAILHGGEYVLRNSAVKKYGWGMLQNINQGTYNPKPFENGGIIPEYKVGGAVKGGAGKKKKKKTEKEKNQEDFDSSQLNPFSDLNYKPINNPKSLLNLPRSTSKDFTLSTYGIPELGRNTLQSLKSNYDYMKENGVVYENVLPKNLKNVNSLVNKVLTIRQNSTFNSSSKLIKSSLYLYGFNLF
jgi:hypothetical protein